MIKPQYIIGDRVSGRTSALLEHMLKHIGAGAACLYIAPTLETVRLAALYLKRHGIEHAERYVATATSELRGRSIDLLFIDNGDYLKTHYWQLIHDLQPKGAVVVLYGEVLPVGLPA